VNAERLDALALAVAERTSLGPVVRCKKCHRRHRRREPCEAAAEREQQK
jgi:hypothetical protein